MRCHSCHKPLVGVHHVLLGRPLCGTCWRQLWKLAHQAA